MLSVMNEKKAFRKTHLTWTLIFTLSIVFVVAVVAGAVFMVEKNRITRQFDGDLVRTAEFIEKDSALQA